MKDSEFINLLNLYLDHEISAPDAVRLEAEVQNNPERRKVYQQYCRMQKACKLLTADFETEVSDRVKSADRKIIAFESAEAGDKGVRKLYPVAAFAAAAACVALIFVTRSRQDMRSSGDRSSAIAVTSSATSPVATSAPVARGGLVSVAGQNSRSTLVSDPLLLTGNNQAEAALAAATQQANEQLAWIHAVQLSPLQQRVQPDELRFDTRPATLRPEGRALGGNRAPVEATVEMTAFRIAK